MVNGFGLLVGHLLGDYILQNDILAKNKTNPHPGQKPAFPWKYGPPPVERPTWSVVADPRSLEAYREALKERNELMAEADRQEREVQAKLTTYEQELKVWKEKHRAYLFGHFTCLVHCVLYTFAVWVCAWWWMPWWGALVIFLAHFPVDRWRLARRWMNLSGQGEFATGPLSPWSIIVVDNTIHLVVLFVVALISGA